MFINKWNNPIDRIIKFLYNNYNADYIENNTIIEKLNLNDDINFDNICNDLKSKGYIDINTCPTDIPLPKDFKFKPGLRITQQGREYYEQFSKNLGFSIKSNIALAISILTLWFSLLQPMVCKENKIIPVFDFKIINNTNNKVDLQKLNTFTIWLPVGSDRNSSTGEYEIQNINEVDSIIPYQSRNFKGKILNDNRYFEYFKKSDCDFTISLNNSRENISNHLPFTKESITEDTLKLIIE